MVGILIKMPLINYLASTLRKIKVVLKKIFISRGVKQKWIAEQLGVSEVTVSNWVKEKAIPKEIHLQKLSDLLAIPLEDLKPNYDDTMICRENKISADINLIGGVDDLGLIQKLIEGTEDHLLVSRTKKSFERNKKAIEKNILSYKSEDHKALFENGIKNIECGIDTSKLLFWQTCLNNKLFDMISNDVFFKYYFNGKTSIETREIEAYLKDKYSDNEVFNSWSASTKKIIGSKYLSYLKKLGLVNGKIKKMISPIHINDKELCFFIYLLDASELLSNNILDRKLEQYCLMSKEVFIERLKKLANQEYIGFEYTGDRLSVNTLYKSTEIVDVLCN